MARDIALVYPRRPTLNQEKFTIFKGERILSLVFLFWGNSPNEQSHTEIMYSALPAMTNFALPGMQWA